MSEREQRMRGAFARQRARHEMLRKQRKLMIEQERAQRLVAEREVARLTREIAQVRRDIATIEAPAA
jgi:hypothetical protein